MNTRGKLFIFLVLIILIVVVIIVGYEQGVFSGQSEQSASSGSSGQSGAQTSQPPLTLNQLENASYSVKPFMFSSIMNIGTVVLVNGSYSTTSSQTYVTGYKEVSNASVAIATSSASVPGFTAGAPLILYGDLSGAGTGGAAVILQSTYQSAGAYPGGSANSSDVSTSTDFALALIADQNGVPVDIRTIELPANADNIAGLAPFSLQTLQDFTLQNGVVTIQLAPLPAQSSSATAATSATASTAAAAVTFEQFKLINGTAVMVGEPSASITSASAASATGTTTVGWANYVDENNGFSLEYPSSLIVASIPQSSDTLGGVTLSFPKSYYTLQNTTETKISVTASSTDFAGCLAPVTDDPNILPTQITVNNTPVYQFLVPGDCGAGTCYDTEMYEMPYGNTCYSFVTQTRTGNPGNYDFTQAEIQQVEKNDMVIEHTLTNIAKQVLATFQIVK